MNVNAQKLIIYVFLVVLIPLFEYISVGHKLNAIVADILPFIWVLLLFYNIYSSKFNWKEVWPMVVFPIVFVKYLALVFFGM